MVMNHKIIIKGENDEVLYDGFILDIPIKESYIIDKSIEIFNDDDPCIIHRSYVVKNIVDDFLRCLEAEKGTKINLSNCDNDKISFINIPQIYKSILYLGE